MGGGEGAQESKRGYPGEKPNSSRAVGGQLVWVDLELRGRLSEKNQYDPITNLGNNGQLGLNTAL